MTIAINTRFFLNAGARGANNFFVDCFTELATKYPQHHFLFIFDEEVDKKFITSKNITALTIKPLTKHPLVWKYWYNYKIPAVLKKYKAAVFINAGGICSLKTKVPQCLLVQDLEFLHNPQYLSKNILRFYKKYTPQFFKKAKKIITLSHFSKSVITKKYKIEEEKIEVIYPSINERYKPIDEASKDLIKKNYSEGKEYFLYAGAIHPRNNLMNLLKAFSAFKKRQKSNMLLLIAAQNDIQDKEFIKSLQTFKYNDEVKILDFLALDEMAKIMAAAYTFVYPSLYQDFSLQPLQAMQCGVPVIAGNKGALPEIFADAALYANPRDFKELAEKIMLLFKDENKKNELIKNGIIIAQNYSRQKASELFWQTILKCADSLN